MGRGSAGAGLHAPGLEVEPAPGAAPRAGGPCARVDHPSQHVRRVASREVRQPEVVRLAALVLALALVVPVAWAGWSALLAGAFLLEFLIQGRPAALSMLTAAPARRPFVVPGASADLYVPAGRLRIRRPARPCGPPSRAGPDVRARERRAARRLAARDSRGRRSRRRGPAAHRAAARSATVPRRFLAAQGGAGHPGARRPGRR